MNINLILLPHAQGKAPEYATEGSSGMDLRAAIIKPILLPRGERTLIPTGIKLEIPFKWEAQIRPRSGLALKSGLTVLNSPGTIDSDYRGEIKVILINLGNEAIEISPGERIAQMAFVAIEQASLTLTTENEMSTTSRQDGGFGSTDSWGPNEWAPEGLSPVWEKGFKDQETKVRLEEEAALLKSQKEEYGDYLRGLEEHDTKFMVEQARPYLRGDENEDVLSEEVAALKEQRISEVGKVGLDFVAQEVQDRLEDVREHEALLDEYNNSNPPGLERSGKVFEWARLKETQDHSIAASFLRDLSIAASKSRRCDSPSPEDEEALKEQQVSELGRVAWDWDVADLEARRRLDEIQEHRIKETQEHEAILNNGNTGIGRDETIAKGLNWSAEIVAEAFTEPEYKPIREELLDQVQQREERTEEEEEVQAFIENHIKAMGYDNTPETQETLRTDVHYVLEEWSAKINNSLSGTSDKKESHDWDIAWSTSLMDVYKGLNVSPYSSMTLAMRKEAIAEAYKGSELPEIRMVGKIKVETPNVKMGHIPGESQEVGKIKVETPSVRMVGYTPGEVQEVAKVDVQVPSVKMGKGKSPEIHKITPEDLQPKELTITHTLSLFEKIQRFFVKLFWGY